MKQNIELIKQLTDLQLAHKGQDNFKVLAHLQEELGECSTAMCIEDGDVTKKYKNVEESAAEESIDVVICAISLYFANGGTIENLEFYMHSKLLKWQRTMENSDEV